jgi:hypothetical protein
VQRCPSFFFHFNLEIIMTDTIIRKLIADSDRLSHTERLFGLHFPLLLEPFIYAATEKMTEDYSGGYWHFYCLSNRGFYMAPDSNETFHVSCANCYEGDLSADALGIVACLTAYSHLSFSRDIAFARVCADHYHRLRDFMLDHAEARAILGAID